MTGELHICEVPIAHIQVLNPRSRGRTSHDAIVESIGAVGLKRPITVAVRITDEGPRYDLVCGQGRLEAYQKLGQTEIPAVVLDLSEENCLVRSLVENVARRRHSGAELMADVLHLRERGYPDAQIAEKIGHSESWVAKVALLLERDEADLVKAVEAGFLPLSLAVAIACEPDSEVQSVLAGAYASGLLKASEIARIRRVLSRRGKPRASGEPTEAVATALSTLQAEATRYRVALKRAELLETRLAFVLAALRDLHSDPEFADLVLEVQAAEMPAVLLRRTEASSGD